jgi:thiol-disulfide isomerase/thioredoxin
MKRGSVVGLVSWTADQGRLGFAVHARHVAELIESVDEAAELSRLPLPSSIVPDPTMPREAVVSKLVTEFDRASEDFMVKLQRTPRAEQQELIRTQDPRLEYYQKFLDLAAANRGNRVGLQSLIFAVRVSGAQDGKAEQRMIKAMIPLVNHHGGDLALKGFAIELINDQRKPVQEFLRRLAESSPSPEVKAFAAFGLVANLNQLPQLTAEQSTLLESHLALLAEDFADFEYGAASFKELALPQLEYVRNFSIGRKPPDIVGKDIDGNELKLSNYLGKVVVLDFFGDFCVWCTSMYPYERQLVRELADQPFALLGSTAIRQSGCVRSSTRGR